MHIDSHFFIKAASHPLVVTLREIPQPEITPMASLRGTCSPKMASPLNASPELTWLNVITTSLKCFCKMSITTAFLESVRTEAGLE